MIIIQVEQLAAAGQGSFGTPGAIPSARHKNFSYVVPSISQEPMSHKTQSCKNVSVTPVKRQNNYLRDAS